MKQRIFSFIFIITSVVIGLGAFGHASQWWEVGYPLIGSRIANHRVLNMLFAVWLFVSGGMLSFGLVLLWSWRRIRDGDRGVVVIPIGISVFYFVFGVLSWLYVGSFYALFVALAILLFISALVLNARHASGRS
jgi:hypothetical protein